MLNGSLHDTANVFHAFIKNFTISQQFLQHLLRSDCESVANGGMAKGFRVIVIASTYYSSTTKEIRASFEISTDEGIIHCEGQKKAEKLSLCYNE